MLKRQLSGDFIFQQRFKQEARAAAEVRDRHLVAILESAEWDGRHCLASDYVDGGSLTDHIASDGPLPLADVVRVVTEVGTGLDALHAAGVMHRDIKPSNVLFDSDGTAMLTDFGLAKGRAYTVLTRPGQVMGTLDYLAPELIRGKPATPATDIYALGCVAFECVAGRAPFADKSRLPGRARPSRRAAARSRAPSGPSCPRGFSAAILTALEKDPEQRPATAGAYASLLRAASEEETAGMTPALVFKEGPLAGRRVEVDAELVLGREDAGLTIEDEEISRRHAVIRPADGGIEIEDLGSTNGTYVNGVRIEAATRLAGGDTVKLGQSVLQVESVRAAATVAAAVPAAPAAPAPPPAAPPAPPRLQPAARPRPPRSAPTPRRQPASAAAASRAASSGPSSSRSRSSSPRPWR